MAVEEVRDGSHHHFHYDREERLAGRGQIDEPRPKGLFRRNRSLAIILLDIVVIVIMFTLFQFIFTPGRAGARVGDFRADLSAFRFEDEIYATVEVIRTKESEALLTGSESLVVIRFDGADEVLDTLPVNVDDRIAATAILPDDGTDEGPAVRVELELLGKSVSLVTRPKE